MSSAAAAPVLSAAAQARFEALSRTKRRQRAPEECGELGRLLGRLSGVPRLAPAELQSLAQEVDFLQSGSAAALLFLQGDFGNCFYIIVSGGVGLYVNRSAESEMENARDLGACRGEPLPDPPRNLEALGESVADLSAGAGFGEYALLSLSRRYRGASAVVQANSLLVLVPEACYK
jgi:CRP-like cAMP-binding protein